MTSDSLRKTVFVLLLVFFVSGGILYFYGIIGDRQSQKEVRFYHEKTKLANSLDLSLLQLFTSKGEALVTTDFLQPSDSLFSVLSEGLEKSKPISEALLEATVEYKSIVNDTLIISGDSRVPEAPYAVLTSIRKFLQLVESRKEASQEASQRFLRLMFLGGLVMVLVSIAIFIFSVLFYRRNLKASRENLDLSSKNAVFSKDFLEFSHAFDSAAIGMALVNEQGRWIKVNRSLCRMLGYSGEELMKLTFQEITHPEDLFTDLELAKKLQNKEIDHYTLEKRYLTKTGDVLWINLTGTAVWDESGALAYFIAQIENITPRKKIFQDLENQRDRLSHVIEGTHLGTWEWNVQTGETIFNETWAEIIGYSLKELQPVSIHTWFELAHPEDLEKSNQILQKCFLGEVEFYECECRMQHKQGRWVWVLTRGKVLTWTAEGKPEKMFGTHLDISNSKILEKELFQQKAFIDAMLDTLDVGVVVCDEKGELALLNKTALDFNGIASKKVPQSEWSSYYQLLHEDGKTLLAREDVPLYRAWKGELVENTVFCIKHLSGKILYISASGSQIRDTNGKVLGAVVAMKDITASREIALQIEQSERKFRGIFNSTFQFIGFLDPEGTLLEANETALNFAGLSAEDVVGKKFWDCYWWQISVETQEKLRLGIEKAAQGEFVQYEVAVWDKNQDPVTILFNLKPLFDADGKVVAIIPEGRLIQDIVDARKALVEKNLELERFAAVASHDMKEPLRMVISFLQLLEKKYKGILDEKANQYIRFAVDASQRLNTLITDLLEFSTIGNEGTKEEKINLQEVLQDQERFFNSLLEESGGSLKIGKLPMIIGKKIPINLLFRNLIGNSIKYRKQGVPPEIKIEGTENQEFWEFTISDNGIGFDSKAGGEIFEMFKRLHTKEEYSGTGLGLAICKKIVEQHGGEIWAESIPGIGSTFHFTLGKFQ